MRGKVSSALLADSTVKADDRLEKPSLNMLVKLSAQSRTNSKL